MKTLHRPIQWRKATVFHRNLSFEQVWFFVIWSTKKENDSICCPGAHDDHSAARPTLIRTRMPTFQISKWIVNGWDRWIKCVWHFHTSSNEEKSNELMCISRRLRSSWFDVSRMNFFEPFQLCFYFVFLKNFLRQKSICFSHFRKSKCRLWRRWSSDIRLIYWNSRAWRQRPGVLRSFLFS